MKSAIVFLLITVLAASGCVSENKCGDSACEDMCSGSNRLYSGACLDGECRYLSEVCEFGCLGGMCSPEPPHLLVSDSPQTKGNFTVTVVRTEIVSGEEKDMYDFYLNVGNAGSGSDIFSIKSASILSGTGIMHTTSGFSWSELMDGGEEKDIMFTIKGIPSTRQLENTTLIIRTNKGFYYYPTLFRP